jgi:hypothetical protein
MRRGELFWGVLLVVLGGLFFLKAAGYLIGDVLNWFWPLFIVAAGAWILLSGIRTRDKASPTKSFVVSLQGAREASLTIKHGVGRMELRAGTSADEFLTGTGAVAMNHSAQLIGDRLDVSIDAGPSFFPFIGPEGGVWRYWLKPDVPTTLSVHAGASDLDLDLADLHIMRFSFDGGASSLKLTVPARVENTLVEIHAGATSIQLQVPEGVAVRFRTRSVGSLHVNEDRFPLREAGLYQSADYDSAGHRADIVVDGGTSSIQIS